MEKLTIAAKKEQIQFLIDTNDRAVERALVRIFERQTASEQNTEETRFSNSVGFNAPDAPYLTYCAKYVMRGGRLTGEHLVKVRAKIRRYWKQLAEIAEQNNIARLQAGKQAVPLCGRAVEHAA